MKFNIFIILSALFLLLSCDQAAINQSKKLDITFDKKYKNSGFSLIYNDDLKIKKIDQRSLSIFHKNLKRKSNRVKFSPFYNSIITQRIAEELELDLKEPYIDIVLISKNSTYIAKKTKTFEEEKTVAEKAPIDGIKISDLNSSNKTKKKLQKNNKFSYYIKVADFYYKKSAKNMSNKIKSEVKLKNIKIIELTKTNYRLLLGPFNDIQSLKDSFEKMNSLYFENLEIIKDA